MRLCDVYIEPKTEQGTMVLDEVEAFLKNSRETVLIIEAVAGSGKSSLMAKMATLYGDKTHYFIKLSELSRKDDIGLIDELTEYSKRDSAWSEFYQKGNVLFLDGFDEIASKLNYANLQKDIRSLQQKKIKLIITTRPNYINNLNSIPIFLYIIVNKQVNIIEIESQTQLFECVFEQLVDDKINIEQYELHTNIARRLGYFSATYIVEQLNEIVECWKVGDMETAVFRYSTLFDKVEIKEEVVHLKNLLKTQSKEQREMWVRCFQELFEDIMKYGIGLEEKPWFEVGIAKDNRRFAHTDYLRKNKIIALCHIHLMKEVYEERVYNNEYMMVSYLKMISSIHNDYLGINRSQLLSCKLEHIKVYGCLIKDCVFFSSCLNVAILNSTIEQTEIGNRNLKNPMKIARGLYRKVTFDTVTFLGLDCYDETVFTDVTFLHCIFNSCIGRDIRFIDCKMDQTTYDSFKEYNEEWPGQVQIEVLT